MSTTILVVDDRALNREFLVSLLQCSGYRLLEARDGAEALDLVRREEIALIISDILMPVMDGIEFANRLHAEAAISHIPIIFYTATYRAHETRMLAKTCGVAMVMAKPAEPQTILDAVATVLGYVDQIGDGAALAETTAPFFPQVVGLQHRLQAAYQASIASHADGGGIEVALQGAFYDSGNIQSLSLRTAALLELSLTLSMEQEPQRLLELFCRAVQDIMNAKIVSVGMRDDGLFRRFFQRGMSDVDVELIYDFLSVKSGTMQAAFSDGHVINTSSGKYKQAIQQLPSSHSLRRNALLVPIVLRSQPYGWLYVAEKLGTDAFNDEDEQFAATLAVQLAPTYENMVLFDEIRRHAGELELEIIERKRTADALRESDARFRQMAENIHEVISLRSKDGMELFYVNQAYEEIWGRTRASLYTSPLSWQDSIHPDDMKQAIADHKKHDEMGRIDVQYRIVRPDGAVRSIRARGFPIRDETGEIYRYAGIAEDITEQMAQTRRIAKLGRLYAVLSAINSAVVRIRDRNQLLQEACRVAVEHGEFSFAWIGVVEPDTLECEVVAWCGEYAGCIESMKFSAHGNTPYANRPWCVAVREERTVICNDTENEPSLVTRQVQLLEAGHRSVAAWPLMKGSRIFAVLALFASEVDFFNQEQIKVLDELAGDLPFGLQFIEKEEQESRLVTRLNTTLESITDAFIMVDRNWNFTYLNSDAERLLSCPRAEVLGTNIWKRFPEAVGGKYYQEYHKAVERNCSVSFEEFYEPLNLWTEIRAYPSEEGLAIYFADISARKTAEAEIHGLAFFDKLTALPNRQLLLNRLEHAMKWGERAGQAGAVLFIDLDNFKSINDTAGHDKGDILLQQVAGRLLLSVRASDTVARIGGDEYVILLEDLGGSSEEIAINAKKIAEVVLESFKEPFEIAGLQHYSGCSIGIALFDEPTIAVDEVLKRADLAMYQAKAAGRNTMSFFSPDMQAKITKRVALEADLRHALEKQEFVLFYQPQVNINGSMTGVEALVRWNSPTRGFVSPADFIPISEETGLILPLGRWVMKTACNLLARWGRSPKTAALTMAVNVSAQQFHRPDFVEQVLFVLNETGANPHRLKLELTESLLVSDIDATIEKMNTLKKMGILFSLDDFGTGYSSLSYLHRLPLDQLKIDQSFIRDALNDENAAVIARTVLALGKALKLEVIAEGVETSAHHAFIRGEGCREYQGYFFSRPLPGRKLEEYISVNNISLQTT